MRRVAMGSLWLTSLLVPAVAHAHPAIDRGVALYEEADFEGALAALAEAEGADALERTELLRLLATRALVHFALERHEALTRDLTMLASLEPDFDLGPRAPPALERAFDRVRSRVPSALAVVLRVEAAPQGARVIAATDGDRAGMTRQLTVHARAAGGPWREGRDGSVSVVASSGAEIEAYATAIGPGGARLARAGSEVSPRTLIVPGGAEEDAGGSGLLWVGAGAAAVVIAGVAIALAIGLGDASQGDTILEGPVIDRGPPGP